MRWIMTVLAVVFCLSACGNETSSANAQDAVDLYVWTRNENYFLKMETFHNVTIVDVYVDAGWPAILFVDEYGDGVFFNGFLYKIECSGPCPNF